jgi:SAM-dependent methyltransferase
MSADVWKQRNVAEAFLNQRALLIPDRQRQLEVMLRVIRSAPRQPGLILDLGCGDALVLARLLEMFPQARGVAVDFSPLMLEQAREQLAPFGGRARTAEADLGNSTWRAAVPETPDTVVSSFAIHHLPDARKRALYGEIRDLLAEGGAFVNAEHVASATPCVEQLFYDAMAEHLYGRRRDRGELVTLEEVRRELLDRPDRAANILAPVEVQCDWLRELGFRDVDCFWKYFELAVFGGIRG